MKTINFAFGVHLHQPLGNFDHVFESAYKRSYLPFAETIERFERVRLAVHVTGTLWEWLEEHHPEYFDLLLKLKDRGQIELLGGAFYEPILSVIPAWDQQAQIELANRRIKERFSVRPRGMWTAERVWEPQLTSIIARGGIKYVVLDDYHFNAAGLPTSDLMGYFMTEDAGERLAVFPISEALRYKVPFAQPHEPVDYLREMASEDGSRLLVMIDDCEKFGVWPGTHKWVFEEKWLEKFLLNVSEAEFIRTVTPSEYMDSFGPRGRVYLPTCSYFEMAEWTLPSAPSLVYEELVSRLKRDNDLDRYKPFVRGGFWRGFLAKYPESNYMHKRMWRVSKSVHETKLSGPRVEQARLDVMRAQCNCAYWHGVFGGLYLPHLRYAIYKKLIEAETAVRMAEKRDKKWVALSKEDINADGFDEVIIENPKVACVFSPIGGAMVELDCRASRVNLLDTLARRREAYHTHLTAAAETAGDSDHTSIHDRRYMASEQILDSLHYDWHQKVSFLDHFLSVGTNLASVRDGKYRDLGDFVLTEFSVKTQCRADRAVVRLGRTGALYFANEPHPVGLRKSFELDSVSGRVGCDYRIDNLGHEAFEATFGVEFSFACYGDQDNCSYSRDGSEFESLDETATIEGVKQIRLVDPYRGFKVSLSVDVEAGLFRFPLKTVSQSESGFDLVKQATTVVVLWPLALDRGRRAQRRIELDVEPV